MVAQHDAYAIEDFTGGRPCADRIDNEIRHGRPIGAPQFRYDGPKLRPPRLQFSIRHERLRSSGIRNCWRRLADPETRFIGIP